jgi:hypothetical protein
MASPPCLDPNFDGSGSLSDGLNEYAKGSRCYFGQGHHKAELRQEAWGRLAGQLEHSS